MLLCDLRFPNRFEREVTKNILMLFPWRALQDPNVAAFMVEPIQGEAGVVPDQATSWASAGSAPSTRSKLPTCLPHLGFGR